MLDPDLALRGDDAALRIAARWWSGVREFHGTRAVAEKFAGGAQAAQLTLIDGVPVAVWPLGGRLRVVFGFTIRNGQVVGIELSVEFERLSRLKIEILP